MLLISLEKHLVLLGKDCHQQSTTKTVINTISARSSELELQSNNLIKPKGVKSTVQKILPDYV